MNFLNKFYLNFIILLGLLIFDINSYSDYLRFTPVLVKKGILKYKIDSLTGSIITSVKKEGSKLYCGTLFDGLIILDLKTGSTYKLKESLLDEAIENLKITANTLLIFYSHSGYFSYLDLKSETYGINNLEKSAGLPDKVYLSGDFYNHRLFLGTDKGVVEYDIKKRKFYRPLKQIFLDYPVPEIINIENKLYFIVGAPSPFIVMYNLKIRRFKKYSVNENCQVIDVYHKKDIIYILVQNKKGYKVYKFKKGNLTVEKVKLDKFEVYKKIGYFNEKFVIGSYFNGLFIEDKTGKMRKLFKNLSVFDMEILQDMIYVATDFSLFEIRN